MKWLWLSVVVIAADLASKEAARQILADAPIALMPGLNLSLVYNTGMAFGLLSDEQWRLPLLLLPLVICVVLLHWLYTATSVLLRLALALVIGGAIGNLYERLLLGKVTDFIDAYLYKWHWPTFNVADSAITIGVVILVFCLWKDETTKT
ncbi:MAG: signal peptidase II [Candidatus Porifericomitaceae bacterium WSBS_2022_MAG_OTU9]